MSIVPLTILFNISMPQVTGFVVLVVLYAMGDRLGSAHLNVLFWISRVLCHGNLSGCHGNNIPCSERLLWLPPIFR